MRSIVVVVGLIVCIFLGISWVDALENLPEVKRQEVLLGVGDYITSPEEVAEYRNQVNTTYGILLALTIGATGGLFYIANEKDKKKKEVEKWWQKEGRTEYDNMIADNKGINSEVNAEKESYNYDEDLVKRAKYLKSTSPMWTTSQVTEELIKEGFEIDSEDQIDYILNSTRADPTILNKQNNKLVNGSTEKMASENLKEDVYESIEKLGGLLGKGYITQEEFDEKKKKLLDQI